jgi:nucleoside-diphosphate-sugar epimerase
MRVFLAVASGAIGPSLVPQLVAAGHDVTGTTRSERRAEAQPAAAATTDRGSCARLTPDGVTARHRGLLRTGAES